MTASPTNRRERLGATLLAVLLALSVVAGVTGVGTAHGDVDHVERSGGQLKIALGDEHFNGSDRNVTVRVTGGQSASLSPDGTANNESTYSVAVTELSSPETDLSNASVTVEPQGENGTAVTEYVDLRTLSFGGSGGASFADGTLEVPLQQALGYADGDSAEVTLSGETAPVADATVQYRNGSTVLAVSLDAGSVHLPPSKGATLAAERGDQTDLNLWQLSREVTSVERQDDETLGVDSPLIADGLEYDLTMIEPATNATFASTVAADGDGNLTVTDETLASADALSVSVHRGGNAVVENVPYERDVAGVPNASVTDNGTAVAIDGSTLDANETTVWLANSTRYVQLSAPVDNGSVNLNATDYLLNENASYRLIVTGDESVRAQVVPHNASVDNPDDSLFYAAAGSQQGGEGGDGSGESSGGLFAVVPGGLPVVGVLVGFLVLGVAVVVIRLTGDDSDPTPDGADGPGVTSSTHDEGHDVDFRVEDAGTGSTISAELKARQKADDTAYRNGGPSSEATGLSDGTGSLTLDRGTWVVEVGSHGVSERREVRAPFRNQPVTFELGPKQVEVAVADGGEPLSGVPVTCTPDEGRPREGETDADGEVTFDVPLAADEVEVAADHEKYDGDSATASVAGGSDATARLDIQPLAGDLDVTATVGGTAVGGLTVEVEPVGEDVKSLGASRRTATTDSEGVTSFDDLLVGEYEVGMDVPGGGTAFAVESSRVRIRDGRTARESLDASFEFSLARNQRDRVTSIRQDVDALVSTSGRDVAIPRYYGSVVTSLLETVERLPREGHRFASAEADPDEVADALLDAADAAVELVNDAMTTKRNTDLFGACVDMRDQRVEWQGGFDVATLFELLEEDRTAQRQTVLTQLRAVDDRINAERSDLAVVAPARELWDGVKAFVNEERGDDPVRGAAVAFAAGGLLDGVDELFDHDQLRERLERTVF
ncbi:hypothetical protein [Halorussus litoreus]|uniref:hypothetical protein n=1 Tax=Halorussus litoreus TaxID=1710536 RepID=UPI000E2444D2|nr:hypothetical protein [Halorussus litoreus]